MFAEKLFLNIMLVATMVFYWYTTHHIVPAVMGVFIILIYLYDEKLYFISLLMAVLTLVTLIYLLFYDYLDHSPDAGVVHFGSSVLFMIVIAIKSKEIFEAD